MCGKDKLSCFSALSIPGSPPHVRERLCLHPCCQVEIRITPACAGKTRRAGAVRGRKRDHPRMCGKDSHITATRAKPTGSPPHVRERPFRIVVIIITAGITPACAGKTVHLEAHGHVYQDHPRMCGKDVNQICKIFDRSGSPPHVRERPTAVSSDDLAFGITPACAGKTLQGYSNDNDVRDHPRMCGKDPICDSRPFYMLGSPPHVRERHVI